MFCRNIPIKHHEKIPNVYKQPQSLQTDLQVMIVEDKSNATKSLMSLVQHLKQRDRSDNNPWLLINVKLKDLQDIDINLDFDDDIYLVSPTTANGKEHWNVSVAYRINQDFPITSYQFCTWSSGDGIQRIPGSKWFHRRNLQVLFLLATFESMHLSKPKFFFFLSLGYTLLNSIKGVIQVC